MADRSSTGWVNDVRGSPRIEGKLEIATSDTGIFIGGDPKGLRSLAELLAWVANVDQGCLSHMPDGERFHVHLYPEDAQGFGTLTCFSEETELCRLDAKGTGDLPRHLDERQPPRRSLKEE